MTPERYQALLRWLEARPALKKLVIALNRWLPAVPLPATLCCWCC